MKVLNLQQGSDQWHEVRRHHFTASEAAAMMGASKYQTRDQLLQQKATGLVPETTFAQQQIFDRGHRAEERARPEVERLFNEEFYPVTATRDVHHLPLLASFDGITLDHKVVFEHKLLSQSVAAMIATGELTPHYYWQLEHQMLVADTDTALFVASDLDNGKDLETIEYRSHPERRKALVAGWEQFAADLANYSVDDLPAAQQLPVVADTPAELPVICYEMNGLTLSSNFDHYRAMADQLLQQARLPLVTDQDFADRDKLCKALKKAESTLKEKQMSVLNEVRDIQRFISALEVMAEDFRQARLSGEKAVKAEKENRKSAMILTAKNELTEYRNECEQALSGYKLPVLDHDFAGAIKGKSSLASIQSALNDELARGKIALNACVKAGLENLATYKTMVSEQHKHLFPDLNEWIFSNATLFNNLIENRINAFEKSQQETQAEQEEQEPDLKTDETRPARKLPGQIQEIPTKMVTIPEQEYQRLQLADAKLEALLAAGVENWKGYKSAMDTINNDKEGAA